MELSDYRATLEALAAQAEADLAAHEARIAEAQEAAGRARALRAATRKVMIELGYLPPDPEPAPPPPPPPPVRGPRVLVPIRPRPAGSPKQPAGSGGARLPVAPQFPVRDATVAALLAAGRPSTLAELAGAVAPTAPDVPLAVVKERVSRILFKSKLFVKAGRINGKVAFDFVPGKGGAG